MSKLQTLIALTFVLTACGSNSDVSPASMSTVESTGGSASMIATTGVESTGGSSSESTGGSSANVAGTSAVIDETGGNQGQTTGGSGPQRTTSTGGSSSTNTTAPKGTGGSSTHGTGGSKATGGSNPGTGGSKATGGSSTQTTGGSKATGGSTQGTGGSNPGIGGSKATGGSTTQATGGSTPGTGGSPSTGGSTPGTGGSPSTGGSTPGTGGSSPQATGGAAPTTQTLYQGISVQALIYPGSENIGIIRTDSTSIYWSTVRTSDNRGTAYSSSIRTMPKTGGNPITIVTAPSGSEIGDLVVNGGYVYWMEWIQSTGQVKINKALVNGTSVTTLTTVASPYTGSTRPILLTLRTDGTYLFWVGTPVIQYDTNGYASDTFTRIDKISINGGAVTPLTTVTGGSTWSVTLGGDTNVICYTMIVAGVYIPNNNGWLADARPFTQCSNPSNQYITAGNLQSFTDPGSSYSIDTTYSAGHLYFPNQYGIADELHYSATNTLLTSALGCSGFLTSDTTELFYVSNGTIHQVNISTKDDQPLTSAILLNSMTSDGSTLFWVDGVNIYSTPKL